MLSWSFQRLRGQSRRRSRLPFRGGHPLLVFLSSLEQARELPDLQRLPTCGVASRAVTRAFHRDVSSLLHPPVACARNGRGSAQTSRSLRFLAAFQHGRRVGRGEAQVLRSIRKPDGGSLHSERDRSRSSADSACLS
jgi:hypothetical protein